jgi:hypothetical protein
MGERDQLPIVAIEHLKPIIELLFLKPHQEIA